MQSKKQNKDRESIVINTTDKEEQWQIQRRKRNKNHTQNQNQGKVQNNFMQDQQPTEKQNQQNIQESSIMLEPSTNMNVESDAQLPQLLSFVTFIDDHCCDNDTPSL